MSGKSIYFLVVLSIILSSCNSLPQASISTPVITAPSPIPEVTASPTQAPTETPIAGELSQEALTQLQEFFGADFTVQKDGKLIDKTTGAEVPGFTVIPF